MLMWIKVHMGRDRDVAASHLFVAKVKGSEQQAARSGVFPQKQKNAGIGTGIGVLALPGVWHFCRLLGSCAAVRSDHGPTVRSTLA